MADYLEEAADAARKAQKRYDGMIISGDAGEGLLRVADIFTRLAAIEKGLLSSEMTGTPAPQE